MCKRREDDLTDEINPCETVITAASTMTTWQLDCLEIGITVPITVPVLLQTVGTLFLILTHTEIKKINLW